VPAKEGTGTEATAYGARDPDHGTVATVAPVPSLTVTVAAVMLLVP